MIKYKQGNLLDVTEGIIAHGCNARGVMGSGVALAVKNKYPLAYDSYLFHIEYSKRPLGTVDIIRVAKGIYVANCITQRDYGRDKNKVYVDYGAITSVFTTLHDMVSADPKPLHIPMIGAGLANGDWKIIEEIIERVGPDDVTCWQL